MTKLVDIIKNETEMLLWEFFPTPKKKKEEFLDLVRQKVAFYKPKMEEATGIKFGEVQVKDDNEWSRDELYQSAYEHTIETGIRMNRPPNFIDYSLSFSAVLPIYFLIQPLLYLRNNLFEVEMRYNNSSIYVPFSYMNRFMDKNFTERKQIVDQAVVHELSHHLWHSINKNKTQIKLSDRDFFEGFASYCADEHFWDIYPDDVKISHNRTGVYKRGYDKIDKLIRMHGEQVLLEIPARWQEFGRELKKWE